MPTYDYYCKECGHQLEAFQKITDPALKECEKCHKETLVRRPSAGAGLLIAGDGFYATMYGNNNAPKEGSGGGGCCPCGKGSCDS